MKVEKAEGSASVLHEWHTLSLKETFRVLGSRAEGLTESEVIEHRKTYGKNAFTKAHRRSFLKKVFDQLKSPLTVVLLIACIITLGLEEFVDAGVIGFALCIAVVIGLFQEGRAGRAFERLAESQIHTATVLREGKRHEIPSELLVPGDIVILQSGMQVPADLRLFEAKQLKVNEAILTGEWMVVKKRIDALLVGVPLAERTNMAWQGTFVADGYGQGVVIATGNETEVGKLALDLGSITDERTPLQSQMQKVSRLMFYIIAVLVIVIFSLGVYRGIPLETMLLTSIAIAVASIPEGLPAAVSIVLAIGMEALLRRGGLVRNLLAAETLGSTTYVLTDKTGTITEGRMAVVDIVHQGCVGHEEGHVCDIESDAHAKLVFASALIASDAFLDESEEGQESYVVRGEPMERAILEKAVEMGMAPSAGRDERTAYLSFTSENRFSAGIARVGDGYRMSVNGAPEYILEASTKVLTADGERAITSKDSAFYRDQISMLAKEGKRLIAVGYKGTKSQNIPEDPESVMQDLVFAGLLVFYDPVREGVKEAIQGVQRAGAEVRLVTGDNPETALTIARAVGIARSHDVALTGKDIMQFTDEELYKVLQTTRVFARVLPRQKLRLAQVLQKYGEITAMTGDGVNDAPALQKANIGVALGSGTEVAKEASDLVLVNDGFGTIYAAIEEGRRIVLNLRKIVAYLLSTSLSESVLIGGALLMGLPLPLVPAQILWSNIIEEGFMSVAFAFEPKDKNVMQRRPENAVDEGIVTKDMLVFVGIVVSVLSAFLIGLYLYLNYLALPIEQLRSIMFLVISVDSLFIAFSFRSLHVPLWNISLMSNRFFLISFVLNAVLLAVVLSVPFFQFLLSYEPLPALYVGLAILYGVMAMCVVEVGKWIFFERKS